MTYSCGPLTWTSKGRPAWTYIQQLSADTGWSLEDLPEAMDDREGWWEGQGDPCWWRYVLLLMIAITSESNTMDDVEYLKCKNNRYLLFVIGKDFIQTVYNFITDRRNTRRSSCKNFFNVSHLQPSSSPQHADQKKKKTPKKKKKQHSVWISKLNNQIFKIL